MSETAIQDMLPLVQMPSRYLGCEINRIKKAWDSVQLHVALAFPDLYEIASSHFGIQILYGMLNDQDDIVAERVFAPAVDMEALLRKHRRPLCSLESATPLKQFDIIGFSLLYELNYTNMLNMLDLAGISLFSYQRQKEDPFIIAGGPCMCNPEPVADFFDAIVIGDGEAVILSMTDAWKTWRRSDRLDREALLRRWSRIKGVYIPSFFDSSSDETNLRRVVPKTSDYRRVQRAVVSDMNEAPFPSRPIIPFGRPIHDRLRMEIARGCTRGCRFCQAGMIYRPVRERHPENVVASVKQALRGTGYEDLSLLSLSTGDYSCIAPLMKQIMDFGATDHVAVSLPSLRAGSLTPELMQLIRKVRKTGFTIAPEAGSQRLRDVINKNITEADIEQTVENAFLLGWKLIKLYFMIGLPTETQQDLEAIVALVRRLKKITFRHGKGTRINVSVATFVPKPHTPFQWEPQIGLETALKRLDWLKAKLNLPGVQLKWQDPRVSVIEGVWARGDRRLSRLLLEAWKKGCRFDGWSDFFDYDRWTAAFTASGVNPNDYTQGYRDPGLPLPWEHIQIGMDREFLLAERKRAQAGEITPDCRTGNCSGCGVCDFVALAPISYHDTASLLTTQKVESDPITDQQRLNYLVTFRKMGPARYLGHLEMIKIFVRSLRRERIPMLYSHGFHPMPKIAFADTLPIGLQSESEQMFITLTEVVDPATLMVCLNRQLPEGLEITGCSHIPGKRRWMAENSQHYQVELKDGLFRQKELDWFFEQQRLPLERDTKRGKTVVVDLKKAVSGMEMLNSRLLRMRLTRVDNLMIRPAQVMRAVFNLTEPQILTAIITKCKTDDV